MKKLVPDPPSNENLTTGSHRFGLCDAGHPPLYAINAGIAMEDALVHVSLLPKRVIDVAQSVGERRPGEQDGLHWANLHAVEMAKGLVDALLDGIEVRALQSSSAAGST